MLKTNVAYRLLPCLLACNAAHSATLNNGDILTIDAGAQDFSSTGNLINVNGGSYFGGDWNGNGSITGTEKIALGSGTTGIVIGQATTPGAFHSGSPTVSETNEIGDPWNLSGNTGSFWTSVGISGSTEFGLNFSGWTMAWNTLSSIPLNTAAWQPANCVTLGCSSTFIDGVADFTWDGVYGNSYVIDYTASVPVGDPSGTGGTQYYFKLIGTVEAAVVPVPATVWLFGSGLIGLVGFASRRKAINGKYNCKMDNLLFSRIAKPSLV